MRNFRLGRLPHSPAALAAAPGIMDGRFAAASPPQTLDRSGIDYRPRLFKNDTLPDCSAAGLANAMLAVGALAGFEPVIYDSYVPPFYASVVGVQATEAAMEATAGARLLDVLERQERDGFDVGQQVPLVAAWGRIPISRSAVAHTTAELGACYLGIDLYDRDMLPCDVLDDDAEPGPLVGGHCVVVWDYIGLSDGDTARMATWGSLRPFTWRWLRPRIREAYGLWYRQLLPAAEGSIDAARLTAAGAALNS